MAKSIGAIIGGAVYFSQCPKYEGKPIEVAILAGYCALGYMAGNLVSAVVSIALMPAIAETKKTRSENGLFGK